LVFLIGSLGFAYSQQNPKIEKEKFKVDEAGYTEAWKNIKKGNRLYKQKLKGSYELALDYYLKAYEYNADCAELSYKIGICYIKKSDQKNALKYILEAYDTDAFVTSDIHFWMGRAYHLNENMPKAIASYKDYSDALDIKALKKSTYNTERRIEECNNGIEIMKTPVRVLIENLGPGINTEQPDYAPVFVTYLDSVVLFTSKRPTTVGGKRNPLTKEFFEDIYFTSFINGKWHDAKSYPKPINSKGNDAAVAVSSNGYEMLVYRGNKYNGNIYKADFNYDNDKWGRPKKVIKRINTKRHQETTLTFSHDSAVIYFVSNSKKGYGGKDIWVTRRRENSNLGWSKPKNLGNIINTEYDEESVYLTNNDSVLYFASKGHKTMGGFDVFKSYKLMDGTWTEPINLGYPINTAEDDMFFSIDQAGRTGYYASKGNADNYGDYDLYSVIFLGKEKPNYQDNEDELVAFVKKPTEEIVLEEPVFIKTMKLTIVKGKVTEFSTAKPLYATIEIIDNATNEVLQTIKTNAQTGEYTVMLPSGKNYGMTVNAEGYMFHSENFEIPAETEFQEIVIDIQLLPFDPGAKVVLRNVFFDTGKATLRPESYPELNKLGQIFLLYPALVIEISGHTDNVGNAANNKLLSQNRAKAVVAYLVSIGVPEIRLVAAGYGKDQPVADNATAEGRQLNRRVEAKILSK